MQLASSSTLCPRWPFLSLLATINGIQRKRTPTCIHTQASSSSLVPSSHNSFLSTSSGTSAAKQIMLKVKFLLMMIPSLSGTGTKTQSSKQISGTCWFAELKVFQLKTTTWSLLNLAILVEEIRFFKASRQTPNISSVQQSTTRTCLIKTSEDCKI
jgi:hypothetical protein